MRFLSALFVVSLACGAAELPSGESLMERYLVSSGGAEAYAKVNGAAISGTVEFVGHNITGPVSIFQQGDKMYMVMELPGIGKAEEGCDGQTSWETNALTGPRIKEGEEKAAAIRANKLNLASSWREFYKEAHTVGEDEVDGKPVWKVELTPTEGRPETFYFDKKSGLLVRMTQTFSTALGDIPADTKLSDYRGVDGIQTPFLMTMQSMSQTLTMHFTKVEWNPRIPENRFDLPDAVKALLRKSKQ